jgi:hypothetical protein
MLTPKEKGIGVRCLQGKSRGLLGEKVSVT